MGFTKLDEGIVFSSIMGEDDSVFRVWIVLLATCKQDGISPVSSVFLSTITHKNIEEVERCLGVLAAPDKSSRSTNDDGRRIKKVDGGYEIINYHKYRAESKRDYLRDKQRKYRHNRDSINTVSIPSASASASASDLSSLTSSKLCRKETGSRGESRGNNPAYRIASKLWQSIQSSGTIMKPPNLNRWALEIEYLHENGKPWDLINCIMQMARKDSFWGGKKGVLKSAKKLCDHINDGKFDKFIPEFFRPDDEYCRDLAEQLKKESAEKEAAGVA